MLVLVTLSLLPAAPLDQLVQEAWRASPEVAAAAATVAVAEASVERLAVLLPNPEIEGAVSSDVLFARQGELGLEVALVQELAWPGARLARKDGAERALDSARLKLALARLEVAARVEAGIGAVAAAVDAGKVRRDIAEGARALAAAARRKVEAGAAGSVEATLARADEALAEASLDDAQAALEADTASLCALLARDDCVALAEQVTWPELPPLPPPPELMTRADVRAATLDLEAARSVVDGAELERIPSARLGLGYAFSQGVFDSPILPDNVIDPDHLAGVTLAVSLPVWDWKSGEVAQARAEATHADAELRALRRRATSSVVSSRARLHAAKASAERLSATEADVLRALSEVQAAYVAGALALDEALTTRDLLLRSRLELVDAKRRHVQAHAAALVALAQPSAVGVEVAP